MYKDETQSAIVQVMERFFTVEQGNRVTANNFATFLNNVVGVFKANECGPEEKPKLKEVKKGDTE